MSALLLVLIKSNLAMAAAVLLVALLRRPMRRMFGAPIAYAIWFLVPVAGVASLLPPRVVEPVVEPVAAQMPAASVIHHIADFAWRVSGSGQLMAPGVAPAHALLELLLVAAWALGFLSMALHLTRLQLRFAAAARAQAAGPAVLGFFRPRIVTPSGFRERFTPREQAAILAHEEVHLARQDARINAFAAGLRCLCWFNPLVHLGAGLLRVDQELACDASVVAGRVPRRAYAKALLKSQLVAASLPLGCNWPDAQHPLVERIALLKRKPPGTARRLAGAGAVMLATVFAGLGAWAAQPPVVGSAAQPPVAGSPAQPPVVASAMQPPVAEPMAARQSGMALATLSVPIPAHAAAPVKAAAANASEPSSSVRADAVVSRTPVEPRTVGIDAATQATIAALPQIVLVSQNRVIADPDPASQDAGPADAADPGERLIAASEPRTEPVLGCMLGFGHWRCPSVWGGPIAYCGEKYEQRYEGDCTEGPLQRVNYLGTNAGGADVYEVQYRHTDMTFVIVPPGADGKKGQIWMERGNPGAITPTPAVDISLSSAHRMTLYHGAD